MSNNDLRNDENLETQLKRSASKTKDEMLQTAEEGLTDIGCIIVKAGFRSLFRWINEKLSA